MGGRTMMATTMMLMLMMCWLPMLMNLLVMMQGIVVVVVVVAAADAMPLPILPMITFRQSQTDDKGVFSTSLSQEYALAAETFNLTRRNLFDLASQAAEHVFADESTKSLLREHFRRAAETLAFD
eukprot:TRINITY_DN1765_c0_g1_i2.p1 TRINITY_DN1765_c0_g1~~TRINITY_DN1765_c0_g1_i2.p1  ORF type:complete len:125 (-),score=38.87 TRINITY_DN1765_c0_g1_i2:58-432(-)